MQLEILTFCDAAAEYGGRLNILGALDTLVVNDLPFRLPQSTLVVRMRAVRIEEGDHAVLLIIGVGGFIGAIARHLCGNFVQGWMNNATFPYGTLAVNLLGCLLLGFLFHLPAWHRTPDSELRFLLITGFLGAFTTFLTFGNETLQLLQKDQLLSALTYMAASLGIGLLAVYLGQSLAKWITI